MGYLNEWAKTCSDCMTRNGFNDTTGRYLNGGDPVAQIAALSCLKEPYTDIIEAVRKPGKWRLCRSIARLAKEVSLLTLLGLFGYTERYLRQTGEGGLLVHGSRSQVVHRDVLTDTETTESIQGTLRGDVLNMGEEAVDVIYRQLSKVGHWNEIHPDKFIDLDAGLMKKHQVNTKRSLLHGGKRA